MAGANRIHAAIAAARTVGQPALIAYLTAGFPSRDGFIDQLRAVASEVDVIEIGVPFSDPMADGPTIQRSSRAALQQGVSLRWILQTLTEAQLSLSTPLLLMSYLNPLLAYGLERLPAAAAQAGIAGFIVPDLPLEESTPLREALAAQQLALVQLVTPVTPPDRVRMLTAHSEGFIYAVTMTGTTGKTVAVPQDVVDYFARVREVSPVPVCAGFGIRNAEQVQRLSPVVDGVIVGSALVEVLERGEDPVGFLRSLRPSMAPV